MDMRAMTRPSSSSRRSGAARGSAWAVRFPLMRGLVALFLLAGCATREPTNPLDPENPDTGGAPQWLGALADDAAVDLAWSVPEYEDLAGVRVLDASGLAVWAGGAGDGALRIAPLPNDEDVRFRIEVRVGDGARILLPEVTATPGARIAWALDADTGYLHRLTPDARGSRLRVDALDAATARVDPETGGVLVVDFFAGAVRRLDRIGSLLWESDEFVTPLAALRTDAGWWIADPGSGTVVRLTADGARAFADSSFAFPVGLAVADSGRVWVADAGGAVVLLDESRGALVRYEGLVSPDLVAGTPDGGAWIADAGGGGLLRLDATGTIIARAPSVGGVVALTADPRLAGGVWAADRAVRRVVLVAGDGGVAAEFRDFLAPSSIAVAPDGAEIWIADAGSGRVTRQTREGVVLARSSGLSGPVTVTVAFAPVP